MNDCVRGSAHSVRVMVRSYDELARYEITRSLLRQRRLRLRSRCITMIGSRVKQLKIDVAGAVSHDDVPSRNGHHSPS